jgi:hypothetical protein
MGKLSLFLVLGFSVLYMILGGSSNKLSTQTVENMADYNAKTIAHNIAVSGTNLACNELFLNGSWNAGFNNVVFENGSFSASIQVIDAWRNIKKLTTSGSYGGITKTIEVVFQPSKFSKFAYYSMNEGGTIWFTGSDTIWGPFHTQDYMRVHEHPVFFGKATTKKSLIYYTDQSSDEPRFFGGFDQGVDLPLPTNGLDPMKTAAQDDGLYLTGNDTVFITFKEDSILYRYSYSTNNTAAYLPAVAPNGVIFINDAIVRLKGVVKGQYSLACSGTSGKGTVYLDDDIIYKTNPLVDASATDILGIVAENSVYITDNLPNNDDININASIYCEDGGFGSQNYDTRPISGNINLVGGIIQNTRRAVGTFGKSGITHGFAKRYRYDERFMVASPPMFPGTGGLEIVSWFE